MDEAYYLVRTFMRDKFDKVDDQYTVTKGFEQRYLSSAESREIGREGLRKIYTHHMKTLKKLTAEERGDEIIGDRIELLKRLMADLDGFN